MNNQATKTKSQTGKTNKKLSVIGIIIGAVLICVAPLIHIDFPKSNPEVVKYESILNKEVAVIDKEMKVLRSNYDNGVISAKNYLTANDALIAEKATTITKNKKLLKNKVDSERLFGWKTTRKFLIGFGIRLPYLLFSLIISFLVVLARKSIESNKNLSKSLTLLQVCCYTMALYQLTWVFWYSQDYPIEAYRVAIIAMCILPATVVTYFFKYYYSTIDKLKRIIRTLIGDMVNEVPKHVNDIEVYEEEVLWKALKKVADES